MSTIHHTDSMHLQQGVWFLLVLIWPLLCAMFLIVLVKSGCSVRRFGHTGLSMSFIPFPLTDSIHSGLFKTCLKLDIQAAAGLPAPDMLPCDRSCIAQYYTDCSINKIHGKRTLNESRMCESMFFSDHSSGKPLCRSCATRLFSLYPGLSHIRARSCARARSASSILPCF